MPAKPPVEHLELGLFGHARQLVTVQEVADKFVVSTNQVRQWAKAGWLCKVGIGSDSNKKEAADEVEREQREHFRLQRFSAEALMVFRTEEDNGVEMPYKLSAEATWWLGELRKYKAMGMKLKG
jgi:hypothetical protein